jgi:glycosyltransferase involved in cell wall biosynthesis
MLIPSKVTMNQIIPDNQDASDLLSYAYYYLSSGEWETARLVAQEARDMFDALALTAESAQSRFVIGFIDFELQEFKAALPMLAAAQQQFASLGAYHQQCATMYLLAHCHLALQKPAKALYTLKLARKVIAEASPALTATLPVVGMPDWTALVGYITQLYEQLQTDNADTETIGYQIVNNSKWWRIYKKRKVRKRMTGILLGLAGITLLVWIAFTVDLVQGRKRLQFLHHIAPSPFSVWPKVSIIIPACNEARHIRSALQSVLQQDYKNLEIIVINDRSTDDTGQILAALAAEYANFRLVTIAELPTGWLGKNHALYCGAQQATGELVLFTDADIVMTPDTLRRAVTFLTTQQLDHLAIFPELHMPTPLLEMVILAFGVFFSMHARPWKANDPRSEAHIGIGAFNLVRREAYWAVGGHAPIALRPDDDMKLGKLLKKNGYRQDVLFGRDLISVEWYANFHEMTVGLEKNSFAGVEYSLPLVVFSILIQILFSVWPFVALGVTSGVLWVVNLAIVSVILWICGSAARQHKFNFWYSLGFPISTLLFMYIFARATYLTLRQGGIYWRGTFYPLAALKANRV